MSTSNNAPCISQILTAAIFATPGTLPAATMSQTEQIVELKRQNEALKIKNEAATERAACRYKDMVHANRRAERAEQALRIEAWERQDDQLKAFRLYSSYKEEIKNLKLELAQAQQSGHSHAHMQELQTAITRLEAELAQQKEAAAQVQPSQSKAFKHMQAKYEADKQRPKEQSEKEYQKRLTEQAKQMRDEFTRKSTAAIEKLAKEHESTLQANERLKQQLKQAQQMLEWHKGQAQQHSAQRADFQGPQMAAGIHAGFPPPAQQSLTQVKDKARKRRRLNSTGDAGIPTPEYQQGRVNNSATTPKRKAPGGARQPSQKPVTPTRLQRRPTTSAGPMQSFQQSQHQAQAVLLQAQRTGNQQLFDQFVQRLNADRAKASHSQLTPDQALPTFNRWMTQKASQQSSAPMASHGDPQLNVQRNVCMMQNQSQGHGQVGLKSPFLPTSTPFDQQTLQSVNTQSPMPNRAYGFGSAQQMQLPQQYQQSPQSISQNSLQSPEMSSHGFHSMHTLTAGYNANLPAIPPNNPFQVQATPQQMYSGINEMNLAAQLSSQLRDGNMYPSSEDSQGAQVQSGSSDQSQIPGWASPAPNYEGSSYDESNVQTSFSDVNMQDSICNGFSVATNKSELLPCHPPGNEGSSTAWSQQQAAHNLSQQTPQHLGLDPALLYNSTVQGTDGNCNISNNGRTPRNDHSTSHQRLPSEAPSIISIRSSNPPPDHPPDHAPTSRKRPAPLLSSAHSTPAPSGPVFPVCLHCHENWWNETCDAVEPCQNCRGSGSICERPKCHLVAGTCQSARCPRAHEGDMRYRYVVAKPKTLKRKGKKDERQLSPVELARQMQ